LLKDLAEPEFAKGYLETALQDFYVDGNLEIKQNQEDLQRRIQERTEQRIQQAAEKLTTSERIEERRKLIINQEAKRRIKV
ncbi:MAG: hypothetical protein OXU23_16700, partial [Candidatus Poribacteria bacterium]|nr:hypothetical protein [Candidatus Poribacteria bacterium]